MSLKVKESKLVKHLTFIRLANTFRMMVNVCRQEAQDRNLAKYEEEQKLLNRMEQLVKTKAEQNLKTKVWKAFVQNIKTVIE